MARYTRFKDVSLTGGLYQGAVGSEVAVLSSSGAVKAQVLALGRTPTVLTAGATPQINAALGSLFTLGPLQAESIDITGGTTGQLLSLVITTVNTTTRVLTFSTNFKSAGTLETGGSSQKVFVLNFLCYDGTNFAEVSRTEAL